MPSRAQPLVLVVDDHPMARAFARDVLERDGLHVLEAATGADGIALALAEKPDVVVLDVRLPDIDGLTVCRRLKADPLTAGIPVLQFSGEYREPGDRVRGLEAGADGYLVKPVEAEELVATVRMLLRLRRAEAESEERFLLLMDAIPVLVVATSEDGRIVRFNRACEKLTGHTRDTILGRSLAELVPERWRAHAIASADGVDEYPMLSADGTERLIEWEHVRMRGRDGGTFVARLGRDVTERRRAEQALRRSEEHFRSLIENTLDIITILDAHGVIRFGSPAVERVLGWASDELIGRSAFEFIHPDDLGAVKELFIRAEGRPGFTGTLEFRFRGKEGDWRVLEGIGTNLLHEPAVAGVVVNIRDLTERRRAEEALRRSEEQVRQLQKMEAVGRLAGGVAHDFNNVLTAISGRCELVLARLRTADPLRRDLDLIYEAAQRAADLTRQLLAFSRKQLLQPRVLDVNYLVMSLLPMLGRLIGEDVDLATVLAPDLGRVRADPSQLEQVIVNLAVNARDAMPSGGRLLIKTANVDGGSADADAGQAPVAEPRVMLVVSDTGLGMDVETQSRVFEPFFTTKEPGKGTGLGLATVYGIVSQSGGSIAVTSLPGQGTTFRVYLPRVDAPAETLSAPVELLLPHGTETILLVEDDASVREVIRLMLGELGYTVLEAGTAPDALMVAERHRLAIDLVLTDVVLPGMNGRDLAAKLHGLHPGLRVLYMSGYTDDAIGRHGVLEPGILIVEKPFTAETLAIRVREAIST